MPVNLKGPLSSLLMKMGLMTQGEGKLGAKLGTKGEGKDPALGASRKGQEMGEDGIVLFGLGYNLADKTKGKKNISEMAHVEEFLKAAEDEGPALLKGSKETKEGKKEERADKKEGKDELPANDKRSDKADENRDRQEMRREEARDDARARAQQQEVKERPEVREAREPPPEQPQRERQEDDRNKAAGGWAREDGEEESDDQPGGDRQAEVYSDKQRCHGHLDNGHRCARRSIQGTPYCRAHATSFVE